MADICLMSTVRIANALNRHDQIIWGNGMGFIKTILIGMATSALLVTNVNARDNVRFNVSIGNYGQSTTTHTQVITHYPNTVIYSRTPQVIYHSAPTVIQYVPVIGHYNIRPRQFNYYRQWNNGWGNNHQHLKRNKHLQRHNKITRNQNIQRRNQAPIGNRQMQRQRAENHVGYYRGNYKSRW